MRFLFISLLFLYACRSVNEREYQHIDKNKANLVAGKTALVFVSNSLSDSTLLTCDYMFYKCFDQQCDATYQKKANDLVIEFVSSNTSFEKNSGYPEILDENYFKNQLENFRQLAKTENSASIFENLWQLELHNSIDEFKNYILLNNSVWSFTGGAHGNGYAETMYLRKPSGEILELKELFNDLSAVTKIGEKYFRLKNELPENESLSELGYWFTDDSFYLSNNFTFAQNGLQFFYNTYEIAPYVIGAVEFEIPYTDLEKYLIVDPRK